MRGDWQTVKLVDACKVYQPKTISKKEMLPDGEFVVFGANGIIGRYDKYNHEESQVLVTCRGATCGSINVSEPHAWITGNAMVIRPITDGFSKLYLEYYLRGAVDFSAVITGAAQPQITRQSLAKEKFSYPPLPEQERIVSILDKAFEGIDKAIAQTEQNLASARELFESYLNNIFTQKGEDWVEKKLCDLCGDGKTITYGVIKLGEHCEDGVPCLRTSNVRWLSIETGTLKKITPELSKDYSRTILSGGEVLVNVRGTLGGVSVVPKKMAGWNVSREVAVVPVDDFEVVSDYVAYFIGTQNSQKWLTGVLKGVAYTGINLTDLRNLPIAFPKEKESQRELVDLIRGCQESYQKLQALYTQKLNDLKELKQSLLQQAFAGELTKEDAA